LEVPKRYIKDLGLISPASLRADPKSPKRQSSHQCLFAHLGSVLAKAGCKIIVKLATAFDLDVEVVVVVSNPVLFYFVY